MDRDLTQLSYDKFILESKIAINKAQYNFQKEKIEHFQSEIEKTEMQWRKNVQKLQSVTEQIDQIQFNKTGE